jgi:Kef-type K+ transport system membrane component KefB
LSNLITHDQLIVLLLSMAVMLIFSRIASEFGRMFRFPAVMGEILMGILLGPTVLGKVAPALAALLFPATGNAVIALEGIFKISVIMMLFVAGMEVQLPMVMKQGKAAISTGFFGMVIPFLLGFSAAWFFPHWFGNALTPPLQFALFMGTAFSISALPVIARILIDLNLFKTKLGMVIIASAMLIDLLGWLVFSLILATRDEVNGFTAFYFAFSYIILFGVFMLTIGKRILNMSLPWIQTRLSWPGGVLGISLGICFLCAGLTEFFGIHAVLGAFIAGIAIGDSAHLRDEAREIIHQFVTNIFAPLFFVSIGLRLDFLQNFDGSLVLIVLLISYFSKIFGATIGARIGGFSRKESLAVGFGLNARGAMEIILGSLALNYGIIEPRVFVALVIMALLTSLTSGPALRILSKT